MELFWVGLIIVILLGLSGVYVWRQVQTLRWLRTQENMPSEDQTYYRRRSYRRLAGCVLTLVLAGLFIGLVAFGVIKEMDRLLEQAKAAKENERAATPEEEASLAFVTYYVCAIGLVVMAWLAVAFVDLIATRKFGMRHRKRIQEDRRAMLLRQLPQLRRERQERDGAL